MRVLPLLNSTESSSVQPRENDVEIKMKIWREYQRRWRYATYIWIE